MKIAAYCRVSTEKEEQLDSLQHQKEFFVEYARRNGHELYRLYADEGITGTSLKKRDQFQRLIQDARLGRFQMVVVKDISRFARNTVDALQSIRSLKSMGINTLFLTANMDTMGDSEFVITLFSAMAQEESNNLSKRVKWGKRINAEKGRVPQRIFGYDRRDLFTLEINPEEARVVRKIFALYCDQGLGCRTISLTLNRERERTKFGSEWNPRAVRRILTNPIYSGTLVNHKYEVEDFLTGRQVPIPKEQQFCHDRPALAIIPPEEFQKAQEILRARQTKFDSGEPFRQGRYSSKHSFSTLIKCAHCGRSFTRKTYTYEKTRTYWKCVTNDQYTAEACDNRVKLEEPLLLERLRQYIGAAIGDELAFTAQVLSVLDQKRSPARDPAARKKSLVKRRESLLAKQERYRELYANGFLELPQLRQKLAETVEELQKTERELEGSKEPDSTGETERREMRRFLNMENVANSDMRRLVSYISVDREGNVRVALNKLPDLPNWCP